MPTVAALAEALIANSDVEPSAARFIAAEVLERVTYDDAGQPSQSVPDLLAEFRMAYPLSFRPKPIEEVPSNPFKPGSATAKAYAESQAARIAQAADDAKVNPWDRATWSVTRQVYLDVQHPDVAAEMKARAGK